MARKIGIFGGSFNPPHIAHLIVAETIRDQFNLDLILWIPNSVSPHKAEQEVVQAHHRLQMTRLSIQSNPAFEVSSIEADREGISYTIDTIDTLLATYQEDTFFLMLGGDSLRQFMTWREPSAIISKTPLIVYRRPSMDSTRSEAERAFQHRISYAEAPLLEISAADIRKRIRESKSIRYLVTNSVHSYILKHRLYSHS